MCTATHSTQRTRTCTTANESAESVGASAAGSGTPKDPYALVASVAVLGAGGHGHDVAAIAWAAGWLPEFFDDADDFYLPTDAVSGSYVVGVNDPATRRRLAVGVSPVTLVHPTATVDPSATLAPGCVVGAGCHLGPRVALGPHVHIGAGCTVTRTKVGAYTTISPGVNVAGDVTIGEECLVGVGATISKPDHHRRPVRHRSRCRRRRPRPVRPGRGRCASETPTAQGASMSRVGDLSPEGEYWSDCWRGRHGPDEHPRREPPAR